MHKSAPYRRLLLGSLLFIAVIALLVYGIGWETLKSRREDLIYLGQQHMFLVVCSMLLSLLVGIPSGILLSRPFARRWAEHAIIPARVSFWRQPCVYCRYSIQWRKPGGHSQCQAGIRFRYRIFWPAGRHAADFPGSPWLRIPDSID